jgi:hypothetical protein
LLHHANAAAHARADAFDDDKLLATLRQIKLGKAVTVRSSAVAPASLTCVDRYPTAPGEQKKGREIRVRAHPAGVSLQ